MSKLLTKKYVFKNSKSTANGKTFGRIVHTETLTTNGFANHISSHGSPYDRATIIGVLTAACDCLVELTMDSKKVTLGDLGTFYMSAESEGADTEGEFSVENVTNVHLRFLPNMKKEYPLDSVSLRKKAKLMDIEKLLSGDDETPDNGD